MRGLFDYWKERYDARGDLNTIDNMKASEREEALARIAQNNPKRHQIMQGYINEPGSKWTDLRQNPAPQPGTGNVNQNARVGQQATRNLLGDTDWPQKQPWQDNENWNKWKNPFNGVEWGNGLRF